MSLDEAIKNVPCPTCKKPVGERCVMVSFKHLIRQGLTPHPFPTTTHKRRIRDYEDNKRNNFKV